MTRDKEKGGGDPPRPPETPDPIVFERRPGESPSEDEGDADLPHGRQVEDDPAIRIGPPTGL